MILEQNLKPSGNCRPWKFKKYFVCSVVQAEHKKKKKSNGNGTENLSNENLWPLTYCLLTDNLIKSILWSKGHHKNPCKSKHIVMLSTELVG